MDNFITETLKYKCKQHKRGCKWTGAINDYTRTVSIVEKYFALSTNSKMKE